LGLSTAALVTLMRLSRAERVRAHSDALPFQEKIPQKTGDWISGGENHSRFG
jgi:hypothetical protein